MVGDRYHIKNTREEDEYYVATENEEIEGEGCKIKLSGAGSHGKNTREHDEDCNPRRE